MVHPRSEWTNRPVPNPAPAGNVPFGFLHHEGGPARGVPSDKAAVLRSIEANVIAKGYTAIDYNLMVFADGDVWEGRGCNHEDGATLHHNTDGLSVCAVGNFEIEPAPDVLVDGIGVAFAHAITGGWLRNPPTIMGHRTVFPTACPGTNLFARMGDVRLAITRALGAPATEDDLTPEQARQLQALNDLFFGGKGPSMIHDIEGIDADIQKRVKALQAVPPGAPAPVDVDALATAVADKLAERLKA